MKNVIKRSLPLVFVGGLAAFVISSYKPAEEKPSELGVPISTSVGFGLIEQNVTYADTIGGKITETVRRVPAPYGALSVQYKNSDGKVRNLSTGVVREEDSIYNLLLACAGLQQEIQGGNNREVLFGKENGRLSYVKFEPASPLVDILKF